MRVSSLSDERVIQILRKHFVPAWLSRDHYQLGETPRAERDELYRIDSERARRKLTGGTVCVFVLAADGSVLATLPVQQAYQPENLLPFLQALIEKYKFGKRSPEAIASSTSAPVKEAGPQTEGGRLFSVYTRFDDSGATRGVSHDRVELTRAEWSAFLPPEGARVGDSWQVPPKVAAKLLRYAYPPLPIWDARESRVREAKLRVTVTAASDSEISLRIEGRLELVYPFKGEKTDGVVSASLEGAARANRAERRLAAFQLIAEGARYVWYWEGKPIPRKMVVAVEME